MKKLFILISFITTLTLGIAAHAADWKSDIDAAIKYSNFNKINTIAATHPESQGAIAVYLLKAAQTAKNPQLKAQIFKSAGPFVGSISKAETALAHDSINGTVKVAADPTFKNGHPREAGDILLSALEMSNQPNIAAHDPKLHAEVLAAADDFEKAHPQDADRRRLERASLAQRGSSGNSSRGASNTNPAIAGAAVGSWKNDIDAAVKYNNYNQINVIAASHPESQGPIAIYLLQLAQAENNTQRQVQLFKAATPFVGRVSAADAGKAGEIISYMLKIAADPTFQKGHPREAGDLFLAALIMSNQPNIVANDPNLHHEVLEAADDFIKAHPQDANKRLLEQVSLAQAGGAPETPPRGVINPSAE